MQNILREFKCARALLKEAGFKALIQKYGWKLFAIIFGYYLIRDVTLYILIPMSIIKFL